MKTLIKTLMLLGIIGTLVACNQTESNQTEPSIINEESKIKDGMTKVTILYPNGEGKTFDMDYYTNSHIPMVADLAGNSLKAVSIDNGIAGGAPDSPAPYLAIAYLYFEKPSAFQNSLGPHTEQLMGDIPNFTNSEPIFQISLIQRAE